MQRPELVEMRAAHRRLETERPQRAAIRADGDAATEEQCGDVQERHRRRDRRGVAVGVGPWLCQPDESSRRAHRQRFPKYITRPLTVDTPIDASAILRCSRGFAWLAPRSF